MRSTLSSRVLTVFALLAFSIAFVSCDSGGDSGGELSSEDAQTEVDNANSSLSTTIDDFQTGKFGSTFSDLLDSSLSLNSKSGHVSLGDELLDQLESQGILQTSNDQLTYQGGKYKWEGSSWNRTGDTDKLIVLKFPSTRGGSNNLTFRLSSYKDEQVTLESNDVYAPTVVKASLSESGTKIFSVDLSNTTFYDVTAGPSGSQYEPPKSFSLAALTDPLRHDLEFSSASKKEFTIDFSLERDGSLAFGVLATTTLTQNFDNITSGGAEEIIDELSGDVDLNSNLKLEYDIDVNDFLALDDGQSSPSVQELNDELSVVAKVNGDNAGRIIFAQEVSIPEQQQFSDPELVFEYPGGSKEPLQSAFSSSSDFTSNSKTGGPLDTIKRVVSTIF